MSDFSCGETKVRNDPLGVPMAVRERSMCGYCAPLVVSWRVIKHCLCRSHEIICTVPSLYRPYTDGLICTQMPCFLEGTFYSPAGFFLYRCQDYLQIIRPPFGGVEECGTTPSSSSLLQLENGRFTVVFRTSEKIFEGGGFEMYVLCYRPLETGMDGN